MEKGEIIENKIVSNHIAASVFFVVFTILMFIFTFAFQYANVDYYIQLARIALGVLIILVAIQTFVTLRYNKLEKNSQYWKKEEIVIHKYERRLYRLTLIDLIFNMRYRFITDKNKVFSRTYKVSKEIYDKVEAGDHVELSVGKYTNELKQLKKIA